MTMFECWLCRTDALSAGVSIGARPRHASHTPVWAIHTYIDLHQPDDTTHDIHTGPYRHTSVTCSPIGLYRYSSTVAGNKEKKGKKKEKRKKEKRKKEKGKQRKGRTTSLIALANTSVYEKGQYCPLAVRGCTEKRGHNSESHHILNTCGPCSIKHGQGRDPYYRACRAQLLSF